LQYFQLEGSIFQQGGAAPQKALVPILVFSVGTISNSGPPVEDQSRIGFLTGAIEKRKCNGCLQESAW